MKIKYNFESVCGNLHNLWQAEKYCDVVLSGADGRSIILAHRLVLEASSPYFVDRIGNTVGNEHIVITAIDGATLKRLVGACYSGSLEVNKNNVSSLYMGAIHLQLNDLVTAIDGYIVAHLSSSNCLHFYQLAQMFSQSVLLKAIENYISAHFIQISYQSSFLELDVRRFNNVFALGQSVPSAEDLFCSVINWIQHAPAGQRNDVLSELLPNLRLSSMSRKFLLEYVKPHCKPIQAAQFVNEVLERHFESIPLVPTEVRREKLIAVTDGWRENKVMEYSFERRNWSTIDKLPFELCNFSVVYSVALNSLCFIGGCLNNSPVSDFLVWNLQTRIFTKLTEMRESRINAAVVSINNGSDKDGDLFVVGGWNGKCQPLNVERLSFKTGQWNLVDSMNEIGLGARLITVGNRVYYVGGRNSYVDLKSVPCYDLIGERWKNLASLHHGRYNCGVITDGEKLYVIGGGSNVIECYDPNKNEWTEVCTVRESKHVISCVRQNNRILAFGDNTVLISNGNWKIWKRSKILNINDDIFSVFSIPQ